MSLKDEFLKAKLIDKKQLKRLEHEERVEKKKLGEKGLQEKEQKRLENIEEKMRENKKRDQELAKEQQKIQAEKSQDSQIDNIIAQGKITEGVTGSSKFYFVAQNGKIPFLMLSEIMVRNLERGNAAIVEYPGNTTCEFFIVNGACAEKLRSIQPDVVRFYQN